MSSQILTIAAKDRRILFRERNFLIILSIFLLMSVASSAIGWFSQHTINAVYQAASEGLIAAGKTVPPPPFDNNELMIMKNMVIYVTLIGALLAIILGNIITVNDRKGSLSRVLFTRLASSSPFFWGKTLCAMATLAVTLGLSFLVSLLSLAILNSLSFHTLQAVSDFYFGGTVYLSGYLFLGIYFGMSGTNSTRAILIPILIWSAITFALPQISLALYPTGSLNPVLPNTGIVDSHILSVLHTLVYPFSVSEHFKEFSGAVLGLTVNPSPSNITRFSETGNMLVIALWAAVTFLLSLLAVKKYTPENGDLHD